MGSSYGNVLRTGRRGLTKTTRIGIALDEALGKLVKLGSAERIN